MHFPTKKDANGLQPEFLRAAGAVREYGGPSDADGADASGRTLEIFLKGGIYIITAPVSRPQTLIATAP
jgi:hypothetical protein